MKVVFQIAKVAFIVMALACGTSAVAPDASVSDAGEEKKAPPTQDAGDDGGVFTGPGHLADTGLYSDFASRTLAPGIVEYTPRYPLWSDGAEKKRYLLLPPNTQIDDSDMDNWVFPVGTKVWKEFDVGNVAVETRLLWKVGDTTWWEVAYAWNQAGTDAVAAPDGGVDALGTNHDVPSQQDCAACHANVRDVLIGVSALQLGATDGDGTLAALADAGALAKAPVAYDAPGAGVTKDALGYLHANCGHCHNGDWASPTLQKQTNLRLRLSVSDVDPSAVPAVKTATCLPMKHLVPPDVVYALVPGDPDASGIAARMNRRDSFGMPAVCTKEVDEAGVATVSAWIASLDAGACSD
ncbi:MAG TPA: hypothetical protein VGH28_20940 [Polyangiaceae bacterium]|jgi:hypothetical protein